MLTVCAKTTKKRFTHTTISKNNQVYREEQNPEVKMLSEASIIVLRGYSEDGALLLAISLLSQRN